jgi:hypothetical protein
VSPAGSRLRDAEGREVSPRECTSPKAPDEILQTAALVRTARSCSKDRRRDYEDLSRLLRIGPAVGDRAGCCRSLLDTFRSPRVDGTSRGGEPSALVTSLASWANPGRGCRGQRFRSSDRLRSLFTQIYEGTNQVQRIVMARQLLKD